MRKDAKTKSIEIKSLRERILLHEEYFEHEINPYNIIYTPYDGKDEFDATWICNTPKGQITIIAEAKVRNYSLQYEGYMIQKNKYDYLMSRANEFDFCFYICFLTDGIIVWDLKRIEEPQWKEMTGEVNNFNNEKVMKQSADLKKKQAVRIINKPLDLFKALCKAEDIWLKRNEW